MVVVVENAYIMLHALFQASPLRDLIQPPQQSYLEGTLDISML